MIETKLKNRLRNLGGACVVILLLMLAALYWNAENVFNTLAGTVVVSLLWGMATSRDLKHERERA